MKKKPNILVAPLHWGLGHATRCMPIIDELISQGANVFLASDGAALELLKQTYPSLPAINLPAYDVHYKSTNMFLNMGLQLPKFLKAIALERKYLKTIIEKYKIDALISDNRFGFYNKSVYAVFLTHQLQIQSPYSWLSKIVNYYNHNFIRNYDACWVPDYEGARSLAGKLSEPFKHPNLQYIGPLSRLEKNAESKEKEYDLVAILSGPEPQRTILEEKLIQQLMKIPKKTLLVRGIVSDSTNKMLSPNLRICGFLDSKEIAELMTNSHWVLARSGYSTLMDMAQMACPKIILVPTPGQTEQEYLAQRLEKLGIALYQKQNALDIAAALGSATNLKGFVQKTENHSLTQVIHSFLNSL